MKRASVVFVCSLLVCLLASASLVHAGGFGLFEWGNAALGQGTAFYATGDDPSVVAYNPAQMTRLEGTQVYGGVTAISPRTDAVVNGSEHSLDAQVFPVPHAYITHQVNDKLWVGFGEFTRFGLGTKYEDNWVGQTLLREAELASYSFNPTVAYKLTDALSIAGGLEVIRGTFSVRKAHPLGAPVKIDVAGTSLTGNLGLLYEFNDDVSLGFSYRAPVHFSGKGHAEVGGLVPRNNTTLEANFPSQYSLGLGYSPFENLTLEFDVIFTRWELFDKMEFDFQTMTDNTETFNYKNTWRFQIGAKYMVLDNWALRAGVVFDQTPIRGEYSSLMLPANDRFMYTLGTGYQWNNWTFDLAGMYIVTKPRHGLSMSDGTPTPYSVDFTNGRTWGLGTSIGFTF